MKRLILVLVLVFISACSVDASKFDRLTDKDRRELQQLLDGENEVLIFELR